MTSHQAETYEEHIAELRSYRMFAHITHNPKAQNPYSVTVDGEKPQYCMTLDDVLTYLGPDIEAGLAAEPVEETQADQALAAMRRLAKEIGEASSNDTWQMLVDELSDLDI